MGPSDASKLVCAPAPVRLALIQNVLVKRSLPNNTGTRIVHSSRKLNLRYCELKRNADGEGLTVKN